MPGKLKNVSGSSRHSRVSGQSLQSHTFDIGGEPRAASRRGLILRCWPRRRGTAANRVTNRAADIHPCFTHWVTELILSCPAIYDILEGMTVGKRAWPPKAVRRDPELPAPKERARQQQPAPVDPPELELSSRSIPVPTGSSPGPRQASPPVDPCDPAATVLEPPGNDFKG